MKAWLFQLDGKLPNLALMRIAAHHRRLGDEVELRQARHAERITPGLFEGRPDKVYASLIFDRTRPLAQRLLEAFPDAVIGGSGWSESATLEQAGIPADTPPDYSDYPAFRQSMGFTQRGCRLKCEFCKVPRMEGAVREASTVAGIWRGDPWPREVLLLDNDFFGQPQWRERIREIREGRFKVSFNQGINARMISDEAAEAIASVDYRDDGMKERRIYTAWDSRKDEEVLFRGLSRLVRAGVRPDDIMVYVLIGFWPGESEEDWLYRVQKLQDFGARPYPMPFSRSPLAVGFQRWVVRRASRVVSWEEYKAANCRPEKVAARRAALPLFAG